MKTQAVSEEVIVKRINRKLAPEMEKVRTSRGSGMQIDVGDHYLVDVAHGFLIARDVNVEEMGRTLGVLKAGEQVAE